MLKEIVAYSQEKKLKAFSLEELIQILFLIMQTKSAATQDFKRRKKNDGLISLNFCELILLLVFWLPGNC